MSFVDRNSSGEEPGQFPVLDQACICSGGSLIVKFVVTDQALFTIIGIDPGCLGRIVVQCQEFGKYPISQGIGEGLGLASGSQSVSFQSMTECLVNQQSGRNRLQQYRSRVGVDLWRGRNLLQ